jgi:N-acetylmuramoyl-L-alanine amidase
MLKKLLDLLRPKPLLISLPQAQHFIPEPVDEKELPHEGAPGKVKFGVIVGHERGAEGARMCAPYLLTEYSYNLELARGIKDHAPENVLVEIILRDGEGILGAYDEARARLCDCVIELHFNAHNGQVAGSETLCSPDTNDLEFARLVHFYMLKAMDRIQSHDRGVKAIPKSERGGINVHSFPGGVNCLIEPFFGDHPADAALGMEKRIILAKALLDAVVSWGQSVKLLK